MKSKYLYKKLLKLFLLIGIVPILIIGFFTAFSINRLMENRFISEAMKANEQCLNAIELTTGYYLEALENFNGEGIVGCLLSSEVSDTDKKRLFYQHAYSAVSDLYLRLYPEQEDNRHLYPNKSITDIHLIDAETEQIFSLYDTPSSYRLSTNENWGVYRNAQSSKETVVYFCKYKNSSNMEFAATVMKAFYDGSELQGFLAFDIPSEILKAQMTASKDTLPIRFTLTTDQHYILWNDNQLKSSANFLSGDFEFPDESGYIIENQNDKRLLLVYHKSSQYNLLMLGGFDLVVLLGNMDPIFYMWIIVVGLMIVVCILTAVKITREVTTPLNIIASSMSIVEQGNFDVQISLKRNDEFEDVARHFNHMCAKIKELFQTNQEKQEMLRIAEIKRLHSQINPHFLYNTLDSIKYLAKLNGEEEIFIMTKNLNSLLKNGFRISKEFVTLADSLKDLSAYLAIQQIRFPDKFEYQVDVDEAFMSCVLPNLILQPIVENAVLHGLEPLQSKGSLMITAVQKENDLILIISDSGVGMTEEQLEALNSSLTVPNASAHIGMRNVHQRLQLYYGSEYGLSITSILHCGTTVTLKIPCNRLSES